MTPTFANTTIGPTNLTTNLSNRSNPSGAHSKAYSTWEAIVIYLYAAVFIVGVVGNGLVIYTFGWRRRNKNLTNEFLLMCLGICDLLSSALIPGLFIVYFRTRHSVTSYVIGCLVQPPLQIISVSISQIILVLICYDRYRAITKPLERQMCITCAKVGTFIGCVVGLTISFPMFLNLSIDHERLDFCFRFYNISTLIAQATLMLVRDFIALFTMVYLIRKMLQSLEKSKLFRRISNSPVIADFNRTRKLLFAVVTLFTICIFPADINAMWVSINYRDPTSNLKDWDTMVVQTSTLVMIQVVNSIVNVFVYSVVHREFKMVLQEIADGVGQRIRKSVCGVRASAGSIPESHSSVIITNSSALGNASPSISNAHVQTGEVISNAL